MAKGILKIGNNEVSARSSGLTSEIYRNVFGEDLEQQMSLARNKKLSGDAALLMFKRLGFVMCWQALPRDNKITEAMKSLSNDDFLEWVDGFDAVDLLNENFITQVTSLWINNNKSLVELKNA